MSSMENGRFEESRNTLQTMVDVVGRSQKLSDELLCLVIKQTNYNPSKYAVHLPLKCCADTRFPRYNALAGWQLLALLLPVFPPSENLSNYVRNYIVTRGVNGYASYCESILLHALTSGRRRQYARRLCFSRPC